MNPTDRVRLILAVSITMLVITAFFYLSAAHESRRLNELYGTSFTTMDVFLGYHKHEYHSGHTPRPLRTHPKP